MKVIFVVGTTASGKSALALDAAEKFHGAIVNCDSVQLFQRLDIGSAKPSKEDFARVPHFLFDVVGEKEEITAGQYYRIFFDQLEKIKDKFPVVFVVGGTGFYFQAIEKGLYPIQAANDLVRSEIEEELKTEAGALKIYQEMISRDPRLEGKIFPKDHYRIARAVEMMRSQGGSVSEIKEKFANTLTPFPYPLLKIGIQLSKEQLLPRVEKRTELMLKQGLVQEVQGLLDRGLGNWLPLRSVGYAETLRFLSGEIGSQEELRTEIIQNTMKLAKKQRTWFRRDQEIQWVAYDQPASFQEQVQKFCLVD